MAASPSVDHDIAVHEGALASASPDLLREMVKTFAEALMSAEAEALCNAGYGERSEERTNSRNGYRRRDWDTRAGTVELAIPKLRTGSYFPDWLLQHRRRASRRWSRWWPPATCSGCRPGGWRSWSSSSASPRCPSRRSRGWPPTSTTRSKAFRNRPLDAGPYTFVLGRRADHQGPRGRPHRQRARADRGRGQRRRATRGPRPGRLLRGGRRRLAGVLPQPDRPRPVRGAAGHLRRAPRPGRRDRRHAARRGLAAMPHPLPAQPAHQGAQDARPWVATMVRTIFDQPDPVEVHAQFARVVAALRRSCRRRRAPRRGPRGPARLRRVPPRDLAPDLVEQPARAAEQRDPPPHRRRRDLPQPGRDHPPRRRRPRRTDRRMDRATPLHGTEILAKARLTSSTATSPRR